MYAVLSNTTAEFNYAFIGHNILQNILCIYLLQLMENKFRKIKIKTKKVKK